MSVLDIIGVVLAGLALGLIFYGGLWLTTARLATAKQPALLALASFWIRSLVVIGGVVLFVRLDWRYGLILIPGFALGRLLVPGMFQDRKAPKKCT